MERGWKTLYSVTATYFPRHSASWAWPVQDSGRNQPGGKILAGQPSQFRLRQNRQIPPLQPGRHFRPRPWKMYPAMHSDEDTKVTGFNSSGSYFNSNYRSFKANRFAGSPRKHIAEPTIAPGPGTYQSFSDFASYSYK